MAGREAKAVFDDGVSRLSRPQSLKRKGITATPFKWMDLSKTEPRDWLYGDILLRKFISMTVAPGGVGKSSLVAVETLAQVTGRNLLGEDPAGALRVWLWNLEDPYEETQKKILAAAKHYGIAESDIGDRLFVDSGRDQRLVVADDGAQRADDRAAGDLGFGRADTGCGKIDVVVIDPFVSCHEVPENDNRRRTWWSRNGGGWPSLGTARCIWSTTPARPAARRWSRTAREAPKPRPMRRRMVRVVNRMTDTDGKAYGIMDTWRYFNTFNDKANMAPPKARRDWFRMESIWAGNGANAAQAFSVGAAARTLGDSIGVAVQWTPPSAKTWLPEMPIPRWSR